MMRIGLFLYWWNKSINTNNLLGKGWAKTQPFGKRLDQKTTFWKKVGPKNNPNRICVRLMYFWRNLFPKG
jgi:hypothetical protein